MRLSEKKGKGKGNTLNVIIVRCQDISIGLDTHNILKQWNELS